jgi:hypothetical protein
MSLSKSSIFATVILLGVTLLPLAAQQAAPDPSATLNLLEETARASASDISHLRIERWKTDGGTKKTAQSDADSIQRNMGSALPELIAKLRAAPQDLNANFKLYRNVDVLYEYFARFTETTGAFGARDDFQALAHDLDSLDSARHALAERMDALSASAQAELTQYRTQARGAQAAAASAPPKKIVIDDSEPEKKTAKKKKPAKPATPPADAGTTPK